MIGFILMMLALFVVFLCIQRRILNRYENMRAILREAGIRWPYEHDGVFFLKVAFSRSQDLVYPDFPDTANHEIAEIVQLRNKWILWGSAIGGIGVLLMILEFFIAAALVFFF